MHVTFDPLRWHCFKNQYAHVDITICAQEYFDRENTVRHCMHKSKLTLYCLQWKQYVNNVRKCHRLLWAQAHLKWSDSHDGHNGHCVLWTKEEEDSSDCYQSKVQKQRSVTGQGRVSAHVVGNLHMFESTVNS